MRVEKIGKGNKKVQTSSYSWPWTTRREVFTGTNSPHSQKSVYNFIVSPPSFCIHWFNNHRFGCRTVIFTTEKKSTYMWSCTVQTCAIQGSSLFGGGHGNTFQYCCLENPHEQRSLAGYIQSMGLQRVGHHWETKHSILESCWEGLKILIIRKKKYNYVWWWMLTRLTGVIISKYINIMNHYAVHLKLI